MADRRGYDVTESTGGDLLGELWVPQTRETENPWRNLTEKELWHNDSCQQLLIHSDFLKDVLGPTICCVGVLGILLTMVVLTRKYMVTSCNCYLTALAVGDLMFLIITFARWLTDKFGGCRLHLSDEYEIFTLYSIILQDIFLFLTIGVTVMLAVERYMAVCHPIRSMGLCTIRRARTVVVVLFLSSCVLRSPKFTDIEIRHHEKHGVMVSAAFLYNDKVYTYVVTAGLMTFLPLLILLVLNLRIILELRRSSRYLRYYLGADWRVRSVVSSEEVKITLMLIGVVIAFFVCHVPYMVYNLLTAVSEYDSDLHELFTNSDVTQYFQHGCQSLLALRSSCNFILYCWFSEKFWATFKRIFCVETCQAQRLEPGAIRYTQDGGGPHSRFGSRTYLHRSSFINTRDTTC